MSQLEVKELVQNLPAVMAALTQGDEVILTDAAVPFAKLVNLCNEAPGRVPGSAAGLFTISDDFDEPIDDLFEVYAERAA